MNVDLPLLSLSCPAHQGHGEGSNVSWSVEGHSLWEAHLPLGVRLWTGRCEGAKDGP